MECIDKYMDKLTQLRYEINESGFDSEEHFLNRGFLCAINKAHTVILKVKLSNKPIKASMLRRAEANEYGMALVFDEEVKKRYEALNQFDGELFNMKNYLWYNNYTKIRQLLDSFSREYVINIDGNKAVYDRRYLDDALLSLPVNFRLKIGKHDMLFLNYQYFNFEVYAIVASLQTEKNKIDYIENLIEVKE